MNILFASVIETTSHVHILTRSQFKITVNSTNKFTGTPTELSWYKFINVDIYDGLLDSELTSKQLEQYETYVTLGRELIDVIFEGASDPTFRHYSLIPMEMLFPKMPDNLLVNMRYYNITRYNAYPTHYRLEIPAYPQGEQPNYILHIFTAWKSLVNGIHKYASSPQIADMIIKHILSRRGINESPSESVMLRITTTNNDEIPDVNLFRKRNDLLANLRGFMFYQKLSTTIIDTMFMNAQHTPSIMWVNRGVISVYYLNESLLEYANELSKLLGIDNPHKAYNPDNISISIKYELLSIIYAFGDVLNEINEVEWMSAKIFG